MTADFALLTSCSQKEKNRSMETTTLVCRVLCILQMGSNLKDWNWDLKCYPLNLFVQFIFHGPSINGM